MWARGAADMKTGIAAFTPLLPSVFSLLIIHITALLLLITSDEEGRID
jgi:acetylornithine deacetylase/succinyl-diaminopimelate desuccinylase-like protein